MQRSGTYIIQLLKRFEAILALAPVEGRDRNTTAVEAYEIEVQTAALVRSAEDILSLTRSLKEAWLFGQLNSVDGTRGMPKTDEDAKAVGEALQKLLKQQNF
ncbi:hypothetical protein FGG08_006345 [Glutinoglossum americanum]|uniref:Mediator of RNA polymerase II transcription subunit 22 n=1 Tax=Glutinoglossum americanum TaxID=1670608 RepID=A0A9P8HYI4_9PEZI|nr:hypothetical protein FGG08_006345 [Glutinoglossum americanum]